MALQLISNVFLDTTMYQFMRLVWFAINFLMTYDFLQKKKIHWLVKMFIIKSRFKWSIQWTMFTHLYGISLLITSFHWYVRLLWHFYFRKKNRRILRSEVVFLKYLKWWKFVDSNEKCKMLRFTVHQMITSHYKWSAAFYGKFFTFLQCSMRLIKCQCFPSEIHVHAKLRPT